MGNGNGPREFNIEEVVRRVKDDPDGPAARTVKVYGYLAASGKFTNWDLACFAAEYLGSLVGAMPWLSEAARQVIRLIYMAHYVRFEYVSWLDKPTSGTASETEEESGGEPTSGPSTSSSSTSEG